MTPEPEKIPHRLAARRLMRRCGKAALGTLLADGGGPYVSLVTVSTDQDGSPILLLSGLSDHTRNLAADPRVSLLFDGTTGFANPQEGPRLTVLGRIERNDDPRLADRFLARHPAARLYAGFGDFGFYRMTVERAHWVGGFARALWIEDGLLLDSGAADAFASAAPGVLAHMNQDHADAIALYATQLCHGPSGAWRMAGLDADGADLILDESALRLEFPQSLASPDGVRSMLVTLAAQARG